MFKVFTTAFASSDIPNRKSKALGEAPTYLTYLS